MSRPYLPPAFKRFQYGGLISIFDIAAHRYAISNPGELGA
jgi:hypothetical protein